MNISQKKYSKMVKNASPSSSSVRNCLNAFWTGGLICMIGQGLTELYRYPLGMELKDARCFTSITLIIAAAVLTAAGVFDNIAKVAGAGTLVPITGFSNSVVSPAIEFKSEGFVTGLGAKMFVIAGPVIVYGTAASMLYGFILCTAALFQ